MPLGSTKLRLPCAMYNILGSNDVDDKYCVNGIESILDIEDCYFHLYGKSESKYLKNWTYNSIRWISWKGELESPKIPKSNE